MLMVGFFPSVQFLLSLISSSLSGVSYILEDEMLIRKFVIVAPC